MNQLYRNTTLGNALQETLDDFLSYDQISRGLAVRVLSEFDKAMNQALTTGVKTRLTFTADKLNSYRLCDKVWTLMLHDVEFRDAQGTTSLNIAKVKVVAVEGSKTPDTDAPPSKR